MALTETELNDILYALTPEEQKQLFDRLGQTFSNSTQQENLIQDTQPKITNTGKVYCCPLCVSASYKKHGFTYNNMQRYICKERGAYVMRSINGSRESNNKDISVTPPNGLFERDIAVNCGTSMIARLQNAGGTMENEVV